MSTRARHVQNSFTAGEVSPRMFGRTDFDKYHSACEALENWIILPQGGVTRRPGSRVVADVKNHAQRPELLPFQFSDEQAYVLEAGPGYFRFFKDGGQVFAEETDAVIANGTFDQGIASWTDRSAGTGAISHDAVNLTLQLVGAGAGNEARAYQEVAIGVAFRAVDHVLAFRVFSGGEVTLRIGTAAGGEQIKAAAVFKQGWHTVAFNPGGAASVFIEFERVTGESDIDDVRLLNDAPIELGSPYDQDSLREIQYDQSADVMFLAHRRFKPRLLSRFSDDAWSLTEYTPTADPFTSLGNFPRAVALWKSRAWWAGTDNEPQAVWGTQVDLFDNLDLGTAQPDEAIKRVVAGGKINVIQWLVPAGSKELLIGTFGSEMLLSGDRSSGLVTPANVVIDDATQLGSALIKPERADSFSVFLQRGRVKLRQFFYDFGTDKFHGSDLTLIAEHVLKPGARRIAYQGELEPAVWLIRDDGQLCGLTFVYHEKIAGWHRHPTQGAWESLAVIPHPLGDRDQVWLLANRTINGQTRRYVEFLEDAAGFYGRLTVDSGLVETFPEPVSQVSGLDHLEGLEVDIVGDGAVYPRQVVTTGVVPLDPPATVVEVGLPYLSRLVTLRPEVAAAGGTVQGLTVARGDTTIRVLDTPILKVNGSYLPDRSSEDLMDAALPLFSGDLVVPNLGWGPDEGKVEIVMDLPLPATILAIVGNLAIGDE